MPGSGSRQHARRPVAWFALVIVVVMGLVAPSCGGNSTAGGGGTTGGGDGTGGATTTTAAADAEALTVLVTNDDGVGAPGIDALVEGLRTVPGVEVVVAAPATNQSGTGGRTTPGGAPAAPATTASGYEATAVSGYPADAVAWALGGGMEERPDVVISGVNAGQNIGPFVAISGTVGAATAAAAAGVPALAVSQGMDGDTADWDASVRLALDWLRRHRGQLARGSGPVLLENLNVPTCTAGSVQGVVDVPVSAAPPGQGAVDCTVEVPGSSFTDDVAAFAAGYAPLSELPVPTSTTTTTGG